MRRHVKYATVATWVTARQTRSPIRSCAPRARCAGAGSRCSAPGPSRRTRRARCASSASAASRGSGPRRRAAHRAALGHRGRRRPRGAAGSSSACPIPPTGAPSACARPRPAATLARPHRRAARRRHGGLLRTPQPCRPRPPGAHPRPIDGDMSTLHTPLCDLLGIRPRSCSRAHGRRPGHARAGGRGQPRRRARRRSA